MKNKYFNIVGKSADFYIYGAIVDENIDWWTGEPNKLDYDANQFKNELEELEQQGVTDINIYINSGGGSVFASSTMVSLLQRQKQNGVKIHSYIDGLCASASTYLCMVADDINIYKNSIMMIHKPMSFAWGNANEMQKEIDTLNTIENNMMVPMYMNKAKCSEEEIKQLINDETWFSGNEEDKLYIGNYFDVQVIEEDKQVVACYTPMLNKYKHTPNNLIKKDEEELEVEKEETTDSSFIVEENIETDEKENNVEVVEETTNVIDYSYFENKITLIKNKGDK